MRERQDENFYISAGAPVARPHLLSALKNIELEWRKNFHAFGTNSPTAPWCAQG
jgi:hypothetical protein